MTSVEQIHAKFPDVRAMFANLGIEVPQRDGQKFRHPFRPDQSPSCTIHAGRFFDWSQGDRGMDAITVYAMAKNITNAEAIRMLAEVDAPTVSAPTRKPAPAPKVLQIPDARYDGQKAQALAESRGVGLAGVQMAGVIYETLGFARIGGFDCWILFDRSKKIAEARRLDGEKFPEVGTLGERKSHTLRGSCKSWPLGTQIKVSVPDGFPVVLVEGGPDYLAACELAFYARREFLPAAMLGAGQSIHEDALPFFKGRDVLILAHPDEAGTTAAKRWAAQLQGAGANPRCLKLEGGDLNDLVKLHGAQAVTESLNL